ncbi:MAG: hypothetical protein L3J91_00580, partial [Thermoplasmata archaeon]|nr:hypothetical protein [Thermoplasmata archaeon]
NGRALGSLRLAVASALIVVVLVAPASALVEAGRPEPGTAGFLPASSPSGLSATVTWNGKDVASASTIPSALSTGFTSTIDVHYTWSSSAVGPLRVSSYTIGTARLQMFYFGFPLGTRDVVDTNPVPATNGSFDMAWDPGVLQWVLAGSYAMTASLIAPNGTTEWSESFFIHVTATAGIGAALPIILIVIGLWELYSLARSGREAAPRPPKAKGPSPPVSTSADSSTTSKGTSPGDSD